MTTIDENEQLHVGNNADKDIEKHEMNEVIVPSIGMTQCPINKTLIDKNIKVHFYEVCLDLLGIGTYIGGYVIDFILLEKYSARSEWLWFWITFICIVVPSVIVHLFSCKWLYDDEKDCRKPFSVVLGPMERLCKVFIYGLRSYRSYKKGERESHIDITMRYLKYSRDVSMLRFLYAFVETGPQIMIQLYILLNDEFGVRGTSITKDNIITILKVIACVGSLALSIVSYNGNLRKVAGRDLSVLGYIFQIIYRVFIISSRILALVLFTSVMKIFVVPLLVTHWLLMILWIRCDKKTNFFSNSNGKYNGCFEALFQLLIGFIYVFCYIATSDGPTLFLQLVYYILYYGENISMVIVWILCNNRNMDSLEISGVSVFVLTMFFGVITKLLYYQYFHPSIKRKPNVCASLGHEECLGVRMEWGVVM